MYLIRREDVLDLIVVAGRNHAAAIREEEEKAAASGMKMAAYAYAINVLATLGVIVHDIPEAGFPPVEPEDCQGAMQREAERREAERQRTCLEEEKSPDG